MGYKEHFTTIQIRKRDFERLKKYTLVGESNWALLKRIIDAYEVERGKK